ncbi:DUF6153 family protein [Actinomycetospora chlora]|uniref:DUF6153 family protein n=1 Tax=Actinomycetospora chlora TaxID=663608 RepID=UPI0031E5FD5E
MVRRHGSSRSGATSAAPPNLLLGGWCGRVALLVIALGLVLMHHVVSAHQHSVPDIATAVASTHASMDQSAPAAGGHRHGVDAASPALQGVTSTPPDAVPVTGSAALLHQHPDENGHDHAGSLLHLCLVALVGAAVFLLVLVLVALWWRPPSRRRTESPAPATATRAPPASSRLAELQVLRL